MASRRSLDCPRPLPSPAPPHSLLAVAALPHLPPVLVRARRLLLTYLSLQRYPLLLSDRAPLQALCPATRNALARFPHPANHTRASSIRSLYCTCCPHHTHAHTHTPRAPAPYVLHLPESPMSCLYAGDDSYVERDMSNPDRPVNRGCPTSYHAPPLITFSSGCVRPRAVYHQHVFEFTTPAQPLPTQSNDRRPQARSAPSPLRSDTRLKP
ncbi:hypothetical protein PYCCODRAFT_109622 [Trametes coccinea BRFM310]|uniref:Uncharacterized protein n=1 Tax=Trametes coccinea (strain BRFM310) TaxID=1353009 RepID=A0A1Y2ITY0_TRAC3|nr:hypothetical protein PYCCODRAFT_109622 [Trametes coccinea BRFM310]